MHRMKVTRRISSLGHIPNLLNGCNPFDYRGFWPKVNKQIRATMRKHSRVFTDKTLDTSAIFLERPSFYSTHLRFMRALLNTCRWQRKQHAKVLFIKTVLMTQWVCRRATPFELCLGQGFNLVYLCRESHLCSAVCVFSVWLHYFWRLSIDQPHHIFDCTPLTTSRDRNTKTKLVFKTTTVCSSPQVD